MLRLFTVKMTSIDGFVSDATVLASSEDRAFLLAKLKLRQHVEEFRASRTPDKFWQNLQQEVVSVKDVEHVLKCSWDWKAEQLPKIAAALTVVK